ncbi:unknown [Neodiprion lecontei nucleopolyhedrovirus]|uniref:Uncharacterized protein n=1 Tax=Neodiprion lecontei nucleopolyhedrovirus (strain Canada) TaxID=654906 RepID=Q6JP86_NPVNC|nr:unknown [Neodiprion lecontei nucleopolyhedrovirus]AAQ99109.1 unknown [Neodiprion lecontei nucleopolyhedrovirus]
MFEWLINMINKHRYLGIGNELYCGEPIDEDDKIAFYHDLDYTLATSADDIMLADQTAVQKFFALRNIHGLIAGSLLHLKYIIEKRLGRIIYPNINKYTESEKNSALILKTLYSYYDHNIANAKIMSFEEFVCTDIAKGLLNDINNANK